MATYTLAPYAKKQFFDNSGNPLASGKIYTYASGTSSALTTYQTASGTAWGAYVQLDSAGRPQTGDIYLQPGQAYKFIAQTSAGVELWTQDGIGAVPPSSVNVDITGTAGENLTATDLCYIGTNGNWYKADADAASSSIDAVLGFCVTSVSSGSDSTFRTDGQIELAGPLTPAALYYVSATAGAITSTAPSHRRLVGQAQSTTMLAIALNPPPDAFPLKGIFNGRLTLTTGVPVTTSDVTAATTIYLALYGGNQFALYTGSSWVCNALAQLSIAVPATTNQMYDVFLDYNDGSPALALTAWTNDTTRATALTTQDGVYVKTGDTQQRYVGSFRTTGVSGQTEDSKAKRFVWNYYNRVDRAVAVVDTTNTWTYSTAAFQQANASAANQIALVAGVAEDAVSLRALSSASNSGASAIVSTGIGINATNARGSGSVSAAAYAPAANENAIPVAYLDTNPAAGYSFYAWLEYDGTGGGTTTWIGDNGGAVTQTGLTGTWRA